jgi:O-antigen ligase
VKKRSSRNRASVSAPSATERPGVFRSKAFQVASPPKDPSGHPRQDGLAAASRAQSRFFDTAIDHVDFPWWMALAFLLLAITLPFLGAHHRLPIPTFYQEWLAGILGLLALLASIFGRGDVWSVPRVALLPASLIALVWIQFAAGVNVLFEDAVLFSYHMGWAMVLMLVTGRLAERFGREMLADWLAGALLAGSLLLAGSGALQRWVPAVGLPFVSPSEGVVRGNLAQAGNFADYLWIGVVAALYLFRRSKLALVPLLLVLPMLIGMSLLSGARVVLIYIVAVVVWYALWQRRKGAGSFWRWSVGGALVLVTLLVLLTTNVTEVSRSDGSQPPSSTFQRIVALGVYDPVRITLWRAGLTIFGDHPVMGAGYRSFSREFYSRAGQFPLFRNAVPEHSHNFLTEILADFGLAGAGLVLAMLVAWLGRQRLHDGLASRNLALGGLLVLGIHSSIEYPLWYAYFLALAAIFLSLGEGGHWALRCKVWCRPLLLFVAFAGIFVLFTLRRDYGGLENAANGQGLDGKVSRPDLQRVHLSFVYEHSLWSRYAALQLAARTPISDEDLANRLRIMESAAYLSPIREIVFRKAALLQLAGREGEAEQELRRAMTMYPHDIPAARRYLEAKAELRPRLQPLIDLLAQH